MERKIPEPKNIKFERLKITKKEQLTKNVFTLEIEIPENSAKNYLFLAGQYVTLKFLQKGITMFKDFSLTAAPHEKKISLGIKIGDENSATSYLFEEYQVGDFIEVSFPRGRFTIEEKPHEFRTIVAFASGIGITPILSHLKNILFTEPRTRFFLFYGNSFIDNTPYKNELDELQKNYSDRLQIHYFYSKDEPENVFLKGRLDEKKLELIINQILHLDDTDEESTIWDAVDEVLICGKGEMIKSLANACFAHGILKKNIHFELFEAYNEAIYPREEHFELVENININFQYQLKKHQLILKNNKESILSQLLELGFDVPYSCKSGICGTCICKLEKGKVDQFENEYLTENEEENGFILPCVARAESSNLELNFDIV